MKVFLDDCTSAKDVGLSSGDFAATEPMDDSSVRAKAVFIVAEYYGVGWWCWEFPRVALCDSVT